MNHYSKLVMVMLCMSTQIVTANPHNKNKFIRQLSEEKDISKVAKTVSNLHGTDSSQQAAEIQKALSDPNILKRETCDKILDELKIPRDSNKKTIRKSLALQLDDYDDREKLYGSIFSTINGQEKKNFIQNTIKSASPTKIEGVIKKMPPSKMLLLANKSDLEKELDRLRHRMSLDDDEGPFTV